MKCGGYKFRRRERFFGETSPDFCDTRKNYWTVRGDINLRNRLHHCIWRRNRNWFLHSWQPYTLCIAPCICLDFSKLVSLCNNVGWICYISALQGFKGQGVRWRCSLPSCNPSSMRERLSYRSRIQREAKSRKGDDGPRSKMGRRSGEKVGEREWRFNTVSWLQQMLCQCLVTAMCGIRISVVLQRACLGFPQSGMTNCALFQFNLQILAISDWSREYRCQLESV
jgi:hypothetical protein